MMFPLPLAVATALILGTAQASPLATGDLAPEVVIKRSEVVCDSNNAVLQALRDPTVSAEALSFCSELIRSTATTTVTTTTAGFVTTITPKPSTYTLVQLTCVKLILAAGLCQQQIQC